MTTLMRIFVVLAVIAACFVVFGSRTAAGPTAPATPPKLTELQLAPSN